MNGAEAVIRSLVASGTTVCLANPGTSEIHLVSALGRVPGIRPVLGLYEGVVTGAADGFARMSGRPAAALLHLGPGLANGLANLHNARRAEVPVVVLVGDHPDAHRSLDPPLESDIAALAGTVSAWVRRVAGAEHAWSDTAAAVAASLEPPGRVATLILPADVSWSEAGSKPPPATVAPGPGPRRVPRAAVEEVASRLRAGAPSALLVGGRGLSAGGLRAAARVTGEVGCRLLSEAFPRRLERGGDLPRTEPIAYVPEMAAAQLDGLRLLVLAGARVPVSFFAYPGLPGSPLPDGCEIVTLADPGDDVVTALELLAEAVGARSRDGHAAPAPGRDGPVPPRGPLTLETAAQAVGALLPEGAIVTNEANTAGMLMFGETANAPHHDWLTLTGGAIGLGLPLATGAALACPDRPVVALQADGSALYTIQALWTMAREGLDVTVVLLSNRRYSILVAELGRLGADAASSGALALLDLDRPDLDFVALARGLGVAGARAVTAESLSTELGRALHEPGPHLIEVPIPPLF